MAEKDTQPNTDTAKGRHVHAKSHQGRYTKAQTERQTAGRQTGRCYVRQTHAEPAAQQHLGPTVP